jgi:stalled ribosome alternative rescue factor ArfA
MAAATQRSAVKRIVRTPMFRQRVERDRTKYTRKTKHKGGY